VEVPDAFELALLGLASFRVWRLLAVDLILEPIRTRLPESWLPFLECPWCAGFWVSVAFFVAFELQHDTLLIAAPLAISVIAAALFDLLP
jgi:Protein of unknown function (DUF1360)